MQRDIILKDFETLAKCETEIVKLLFQGSSSIAANLSGEN